MLTDAAPLRLLPVYHPPPPPVVVWPPPPTNIEQRVQDALDRLGVPWKRQVEMGLYRVDLWLPEERVVIECDGCVWHACTVCGYDTGQPDIRARQARRDSVLTTQYGVRAVVHIMGHCLADAEMAYLAVRGNLQHLAIRHADWPRVGVGGRRGGKGEAERTETTF